MKDFSNGVELAFFYLITVAVIARLNQIFDNPESLAENALSLGEMSRSKVGRPASRYNK
jgi:hypothetical protein